MVYGIATLLSIAGIALAWLSLVTYNSCWITTIAVDMKQGITYYLPVIPLICSVLSLCILIGLRRYKLSIVDYILNVAAFVSCLIIILLLRRYCVG